MDRLTVDSRLPRWWPLLFPATYLVHVAEEYWGGVGFHNWAQVLGMHLTGRQFLYINAVAWAMMALFCALAVWVPRMWWVVLAFAAAVSLNGAAHALGSLITVSYSPGAISGLVLWIPLGLYTLSRGSIATDRRTFWGIVALGVAMHTVVTLFARFGW